MKTSLTMIFKLNEKQCCKQIQNYYIFIFVIEEKKIKLSNNNSSLPSRSFYICKIAFPFIIEIYEIRSISANC